MRSEVQVFPGPPIVAPAGLRVRQATLRGRPIVSTISVALAIALLCIRLSEYGALAQLGERVLCKHEVVGSIPTGSTTLRRKAEAGVFKFVRETTFRMVWSSPGFQAVACYLTS